MAWRPRARRPEAGGTRPEGFSSLALPSSLAPPASGPSSGQWHELRLPLASTPFLARPILGLAFGQSGGRAFGVRLRPEERRYDIGNFGSYFRAFVEFALADEKQGANSCKGYRDYRELVTRADIDAIVVTTPDHWHAPAAILASKAGKHVYLEKPCSHNPNEGEILIDGLDIRKYDLQALRRGLGLVAQEPVLFDTTFEENIKYGKQDATFEEIKKATIGKLIVEGEIPEMVF
jgi:hypothetical protein